MSQHSELIEPDRVLALAEQAVAAARKAGADAADAVAVAERTLSISVRDGALEEAEQSEATDIGLRVFIGAQSALVAVGSAAGLEDAAERAVAMARAAPPDETQGLAPAELFGATAESLDLYDDAAPMVEDLTARTHALEHAMNHVAGVTKSGGASASTVAVTRALVTSEGFAGAYRQSAHAHGVTAIAGGGVNMERDYWYTSRRHLAELQPADEVGRIAGERAVRRFGAEPVATQTATIIFEPRAASGFVRHLLSAANGASVARKASFLAGRKGERVYPEGITVRDDPFLARGLSSRPFDGEGLTNGAFDLVADGVLTGYILDLASARKLGEEPNGRAGRGQGLPSPSPTNVSIHGGSGDLASLMAAVGTGLLVTDLIGMGANVVNGSYSRGAAGFWFENGEIVRPVAEITIAGELPDMFKAARFADDAPGYYSVDAPSVAIPGMTIGGR